MTALSWESARAGQVPAHDGWLAPAEREVLAGLTVAKRRRDWRLGRWVARRAVARALGSEGAGQGGAVGRGAGFSILAAADGAPEVRGGAGPVSVSISHTADLGFAAAVPSAVALGCDVERVESRSDRFVEDYLTPEERAVVAAAPERDGLVTLIWSAKESALKALRQGLRADTRSVALDPGGTDLALLARSGGENRASTEHGPWVVLAVNTPDGVLRGRWRLGAGAVWTVLADCALDFPA